MMSRAAKLFASVVCSTSLLAATAAPADACCFLDCLFGCGKPCGGGGCPPTAYYGPTYGGGCSTGNCGTSSYYGPSWFSPSSCGSSCSPCGSGGCAPSCNSGCSTGCAPCASGSCSTGECALGQSPSGPPANEQWKSKDPKTFAEPVPGDGTNPMPPARTQTDSDFDGKNGPVGNSTGAGRFETPVTSDGKEVQQTGGVEEKNPAIKIQPRNEKSGPSAPAIDDDKDGNGAGHLPALNLDEKVASRAAPERKRVTLKPHVAQARLIRVPAYPKSDWIPVDTDAKVAKK
jgi:hypothetical protein